MIATASLVLVACGAPAPRVAPAVAAQVVEDADGLDALAGVERIDGDLTIDARFLRDLEPLASLRVVEGHLVVRHGARLRRLGGLSALERVGGDVILEGLTALEAVRGLSSLASVGGDVALADLPATTEVDLPALASVGGAVSVRDLPELDDVSLPALDTLHTLELLGVPSLHDLSVGELTVVPGDLRIVDAGLLGLHAFEGLTAVGGTLHLEELPELLSLTGLAALEDVGRDLRVHEADRLVDLDELAALRSVGGALGLRDQSLLRDVDGLGAVETVGAIELRRLPSLLQLTWPALREVRGMARLIDLSGLGTLSWPALERIQTLRLRRVDALTELDVLNDGVAIDHLYVSDCASLQTLAIEGEVSISGTLVVRDVPLLQTLGDGQLVGQLDEVPFNAPRVGALVLRARALRDLDAMAGVAAVDGAIQLQNVDVLSSLDGLGGLVDVGAVHIEENTALVDMDALSGLVSVRDHVTLVELDALTSVTGLADVNPLTPIGLFGNDLLCAEEVAMLEFLRGEDVDHDALPCAP